MRARAIDLTPSCAGVNNWCRGGEPGEVVASLDAHGWPDPTPLLLRPAEDFDRGANATPAETHSGILGLHVAMLAVWRGECSNGRLGL